MTHLWRPRCCLGRSSCGLLSLWLATEVSPLPCIYPLPPPHIPSADPSTNDVFDWLLALAELLCLLCGCLRVCVECSRVAGLPVVKTSDTNLGG